MQSPCDFMFPLGTLGSLSLLPFSPNFGLNNLFCSIFFFFLLSDLFFLATLTPLLCADKDEINEQVEVLLQSSNHLQKFYKAANYISYVKELLPVLLQEGIIDGLIDSD